MTKLIIKTQWLALVRRHSGEDARIVEIMATDYDDAMRQLDWCLDVVWIEPNQVIKG